MQKLGTLLFTTAMLGLMTPVIFADVSGQNAAYANNGNGNGGGNGNGNSGGNGNGGSKKSTEARGNSAAARGQSGAPGAGKATPLAAQLKSLNSLNRNINGIMNSSDPKMAPMRSFITASAAYETAVDAEAAAAATYADEYADLAAAAAELGLSDTPETWVSEIASLKAELEAAPVAEGEEGYDAYVAQLEAVTEAEAEAAEALQAKGILDAAVAEVAATEGAASEDALIEAIVDAYNATGGETITAEDLTPEMIDYAKSQLGFGDADGAIDAYMSDL